MLIAYCVCDFLFHGSPSMLSENMTSQCLKQYEIQRIVLGASSIFYENSSKCDKSVKFGIKLYYTLLNKKKRQIRPHLGIYAE